MWRIGILYTACIDLTRIYRLYNTVSIVGLFKFWRARVSFSFEFACQASGVFSRKSGITFQSILTSRKYVGNPFDPFSFDPLSPRIEPRPWRFLKFKDLNYETPRCTVIFTVCCLFQSLNSSFDPFILNGSKRKCGLR